MQSLHNNCKSNNFNNNGNSINIKLNHNISQVTCITFLFITCKTLLIECYGEILFVSRTVYCVN